MSGDGDEARTGRRLVKASQGYNTGTCRSGLVFRSVADPGSGAFLTPGSGIGIKSRSEYESLETIFWVKNT